MTDQDLDHAFVDVRQAVAHMKKELVRRLQQVVVDARGTRQSIPPELLKSIADFWRYDPAHEGLEFGQYVYSLLTQDPAKFSDRFMGYEWNADEVDPQIDILIERVTTA